MTFLLLCNKSPRSECLKQDDFILLQFWKSQVHSQSHWANVKVLAGPVPPEAPGESSSACLFQLRGATCVSGLVAPSSTFRKHHFNLCVFTWPSLP